MQWSSWSQAANFRLKNRFQEGEDEPGRPNGRFCTRDDADPRRRSERDCAGTGAGVGDSNRVSGSIVMKDSTCIELVEALLCLKVCSKGTTRVLTVCPGKYGQVFVDGCAGSCISVDPSISYWRASISSCPWTKRKCTYLENRHLHSSNMCAPF